MSPVKYIFADQIGKYCKNCGATRTEGQKVCEKCGEQWFDEGTSKKIEEAEKKANLFGLYRESKISYSGNSLIVRIPKDIVKFTNLKKESSIIIYPENKNKISVDIKE